MAQINDSSEYRDGVKTFKKEAFWTIGKLIPLGIVMAGMMVVLAFTLEIGGLQWDKFFAPKKANIERQVFEQTKSFTHGKIQDLAKYYEEYNKADVMDREPIRQLIIMNFAEFDAGNISNQKLREFLISQRGY